MDRIPASPKLFGGSCSSGVRGFIPTSPPKLPPTAQQLYKRHLASVSLPGALAERVAAYKTLLGLDLKAEIWVDSLTHRLSKVTHTEGVIVVPSNKLLVDKIITPDVFLLKADKVSKQWGNPVIYVRGETWYIGDFALVIDSTGAYYEDIGGAHRRFNNLLVATHQFQGVGYTPDEIGKLDSVSSLYCWLSMYLPYASHSGARILDLGTFIQKLPMDGREDCVTPQEEMVDFGRHLWKTMYWDKEAYPTTGQKEEYVPKPFRTVALVRPLQQMGYIPVVKGGLDFVPIHIGAVEVDPEQHNGKELCTLSSKASKSVKRLVMAWGTVCEVKGQQKARFRQVWQRFGTRYITTVGILPSHVAAPGVAWDLGSGLTIQNPKWVTAYRGELYDRTLGVEELVRTFHGEVVERGGWFVCDCDATVVKGEPIGWINCAGYTVPLKAHTNGRLVTVRWRLDVRYAHMRQRNLIIEMCLVEESTSWKARSGAFKAMMVPRPAAQILGNHNAQVVFPKDTIKTFDQVVDLLEICAETFSRMPEGSEYRKALKQANSLIGLDADDCLVFDPKVAIAKGYDHLLRLLEDWKQPVTTREPVCGDTAEFIRQFLTLHTSYDSWVELDGYHWTKDGVEVWLAQEEGGLFLYQKAPGYLSTPERPLYMGQKAEYAPVADCVSVGNVMPSVLLDLPARSGFELFGKFAPEAVEYANSMLNCLKGRPAKGVAVRLSREQVEGLTPSEVFEVACETGDFFTLGGRDYPIRLIKKWLGGYEYGSEYTLGRVLGDALYADLLLNGPERESSLTKLSAAAERLLKTVADEGRLFKVVTCCVPAVNCKTVALPEIPMEEIWVRYSSRPGSVYQTLLKAFGQVPRVIGVYRAPMIKTSYYRLKVVHDSSIQDSVVAMSWLASYYDQGDHDGDGRTLFNADGLDTEIASLKGVFDFVHKCLGLNLLSMEGLVNGPKDLFVDHYEWLSDAQVAKKRGIKAKNYVTREELARFNEGSYKVFTQGVAECYDLANFALFVKNLAEGAGVNILAEIPPEHFYGAQTLYEKVLGGWSASLEAILDWLGNPVELPTEALAEEGFVVAYAQSWLKFARLVKAARDIDTGKASKLPMPLSDLIETAWVAFMLFRSEKSPKQAGLKAQILEGNTSLVAFMVKAAYSIGGKGDVPPAPVVVEEKNKKEVKELTKGLTDEQAHLVKLVLSGASVDFNGRAGTGKTFTLKRLIEAARAEGYKVHVCAPTGQAALLYSDHGGTTASRLFGYGTRAADIEIGGVEFHKLVMKVRAKFLGKVLIIVDEKSMMSSAELRLAYEIVKASRDGRPCQWVLAGDYGQFAPVEGDWAFKPCTRHGVDYPPVPAEAGFEKYALSTVLRQKDPVFQEALDWAYWGIELHPALRERLMEPPQEAEKYHYNNSNVVMENRRYVDEFLKANPEAGRRVYRAHMEGLGQADLNALLPVLPEMVVAVGMTFTVTKNVSIKGTIKVANGEQVRVVGLRQSAIEVERATGERVVLETVAHDLPGDGLFIQLPGYVGPALSLYKSQGKTLDKPSCFEIWRQTGEGRKPLQLKNAVYVAASRVTELGNLYFGGSKELLEGSFGADPEVVQYLLGGRRPLWGVNRAENCVVRLVRTDDKWVYFTQSNIRNGKSVEVRTDYQVSTAQVLVSGEWIQVDTDELVREYHDLVEIYQQDWQ